MFVDAHNDVLWKMHKNPQLDFYQKSPELSINFPNILEGGLAVMVFAVFVSPIKNGKFLAALQSIDDFYQKILSDQLTLARDYGELEAAQEKKLRVGILSLEGAEAIEGDLSKLRTLYRLGVRGVGLTWNNANEVADGIMEPRGGGLTRFGREVISEMNNLGMMIDVSHLSEQGFWDVIEQSSKPIIASHSNAKAICNHPRNLSDEQIAAMIETGGVIGVTFVRDFTATNGIPTIDDLLRHIDHLAGLGGISNIGLGSDFDGATTVTGLEDASKLHNLVEILAKKYSDKEVKGIMGENWLNYYKERLIQMEF